MHSTHEVSGSLPRPLGRLSTAQCIEGSRRSTVISLAILVETSGCCLTEGANSFGQSALRRGGHPIGARRSRCAVGRRPGVGVPQAPLARLTVLLAMVTPPTTRYSRVSSPRGIAHDLVPRKNLFRSFLFYLDYYMIYLCVTQVMQNPPKMS